MVPELYEYDDIIYKSEEEGYVRQSKEKTESLDKSAEEDDD